jgi:hypothetical protein
MAAGPQPQPEQQPHPEPEPGDVWLARVAALDDADAPPGKDDYARWPDPDHDTSRPAELAGLSPAELDELLTAPVPAAEVIPAGCLPRDGTGGGLGFADGGALDVLAPGVPLAGFADDAQHRLGQLSDDELIGVLRAWWRQTSWAQARALAAIAELVRRRPADRTPPAPPGEFPAKLSEFIPDEIGMALTLTKTAAETQLGLAVQLAARPATAAALETGRIDLRKALVILDAVALLSAEHAATVEALVLPDASGQTTGELRQAVTAAVLALDPDAVRRRRKEAEKGARVECYPDPEGTATLTGRWLPPAEVLAADRRLCQVARYWKQQIRAAWKRADPHEQLPRPEHGTDLLRARAYLALLLGQPLDTPPADLLPPADTPQPTDGTPGPAAPDSSPAASPRSSQDEHGTGPGNAGSCSGSDPVPGSAGLGRPGGADVAAGLEGQQLPAGLRRPDPVLAAGHVDPVAGLPPMAGLISLTIPLTTLLGLTDRPGEAAGYGPLHADTARQLACALAGHRATRWQIMVTSPDGQALATGIHRGPASTSLVLAPGSGGGGGWTVQVTAEPIATTHCDHRNQEPGHDPSPALQRLIRTRTTTCFGPGCRRPAGRADLDHTVPYDKGGITCECALACGCRHCHRRKQASGWTLAQPAPGVMIWTSPAGRRYTTYPSKHPT